MYTTTNNNIAHYCIYRKKGDSTKSIVKRLTETAHTPNHGTSEDSSPDLTNIAPGGDRMYTLKSILEYYVDGNAEPYGTVKRDEWAPFSFGKELKKGDT